MQFWRQQRDDIAMGTVDQCCSAGTVVESSENVVAPGARITPGCGGRVKAISYPLLYGQRAPKMDIVHEDVRSGAAGRGVDTTIWKGAAVMASEQRLRADVINPIPAI